MNSMPIHKPKQVLVTGGAGFIGSNFIHHLLRIDSKVEIVNLDLLTYAGDVKHLSGVEDPSRHKFVHGDICNQQLVRDILRGHEIDTIVHFAAESHVDRSIDGPAIFVKTNLEGTSLLLEEARIYWQEERSLSATDCRYHQISTDEVYGSLDRESASFTECSNYAPNSPYSASKAGADFLVRSYWKTYGLPVTISCCSNNYGPFQHQEKLIPTVIKCCLEKKSIPVYGDGSNIRDWLHVSDHCGAVDRIIRYGKVGETYNIGGNSEISNIDLIHQICEILNTVVPSDLPNGYAGLIEFTQDRPGHDWRYSIDYNKLRIQLNWNPEFSFSAGLKSTVEMYAGTIPMGSMING